VNVAGIAIISGTIIAVKMGLFAQRPLYSYLGTTGAGSSRELD
jgi:hypothetical protein